ncbi:SH3 domain-containing protein [Luteimicrobium subarcticum]|uniref:SH3 domain-containing protein n=1 Tax=Luteimicrobium subarcticum TaxID=620910 RepID=A0A2M8WRX6_9MICO|nr:SH3 domain-containing protein [Luteimicrobium subarcticum]
MRRGRRESVRGGLLGGLAVSALVASGTLPAAAQDAPVTPPADERAPAVVADEPAASVRAATAAASVAVPVETKKVVAPLASGAYRLSSYYGPRCIPVTGASAWHLGQDLAAADGTPIRSVTDGVVRAAGAVSGFGQWVVVDSVVDGRRVSFVYGHMWNGTKYVKAGQRVTAGQHIADVGANGFATGPHLHLEVWVYGYGGTHVDPLVWLRNRSVSLSAGATAHLARIVPTGCTYRATTRVNLRTWTSTASRVIRVVPTNGTLRSQPGAKSGRWVHVTYGSTTGWVYDSYVSPSAVKVSTPATIRYVAVASLVLRASASTSSTALTSLSRGTAVTYVGSVSSSGWVKVTTEGRTGYVAASYLATTREKALYRVQYVDVSALNLRATPSTSAEVVVRLVEGTAVQPLGLVSANGWRKVSVSGHTGYVAAKYLRSTP